MELIPKLEQELCIPFNQILAADKTKLIHFVDEKIMKESKKKIKERSIDSSTKPLRLDKNRVIDPSNSTKYLGIILDNILTFEEHIKFKMKKIRCNHQTRI